MCTHNKFHCAPTSLYKQMMPFTEVVYFKNDDARMNVLSKTEHKESKFISTLFIALCTTH